MPFWRIYYHLVWATKERAPMLTPQVERRLYPYLVAKAREVEARIYAANGWVDHVHLVVSIPPKVAVATFVKNLKGASSYDLNHTQHLSEQFNWQRGYGVFTLGESQLERAIAYVRNQKEHHTEQGVNNWLERVDEFDDGPPQEGGENSRLQESAAPYAISPADRLP